jgi:hypothetical protein
LAGVQTPVIPGGARVAVTYDTRLQYVEAALALRLAEFEVPLRAIKAGLGCIVPVKLLCLFTWYVLLHTGVRGVFVHTMWAAECVVDMVAVCWACQARG